MSLPVDPPRDRPAASPAVPDDARGALTPAALQRHLRTAVFGHRVYYYPTLGSTNDRALELAAAGEPEGALVLAEEQTLGRGRRERAWSSSPLAGIYASLVLRPSIAAPKAPLFTFMAAVAIAEALAESAGLMARIKWPNDVVIGTRKIAGVLGEVRGSEPVVREMVVGMGVNVNQRADEFPPEIRPLATSVRIEKGNPGDRAPILAALLRGFEERYGRLLRDGPRALLAEWDGLTLLPPGRRITVAGPAGRLEGTVAGVDDEGALLLRDAAGRTLRVPFGEIVQAAPI